MRTDYESTQAVEVYGPGDTSHDLEFVIGLCCTAPSFSGCFNPFDGGEPPSGPEFDLTTISFSVPIVNYKGEIVGQLNPLVLTYPQFEAVVGWKTAEVLVEKAMEEAAEKGDF